MSTRKHDYQSLEREFVGSQISIRELCRKHDIKGYSSVAAYARENGWYEKREKIQGRKDALIVERVSERLAEDEASLIETVRSEWLTVIRAATYKFAEDLKDPAYRVRVSDLVQLIDKGLVLMGEPNSRTEERHLALTGSLDGLPEQFVRRLVDVTRPQLDDARGTDDLARMGAEKTRPN